MTISTTQTLAPAPLLGDRIPFGTSFAPEAPTDLQSTGLDPSILSDLALKTAYTVPQLTTSWAAQRLHLPLQITHELMEQLRADHCLETLGQAGPLAYRYAISQRGRERASRLLEISGYAGAAPVSLSAYTALLEWQMERHSRITPDEVESALSELVLTPQAVHLAGLALSSGRSLFVFGPPGNGKTSLGRQLHTALKGEIWIPYCISVDSAVIQIFDPQWHHRAPARTEPAGPIDQRWVRIRRPLIVGGGELTIDAFDLNYSPALRFYEAPLHLKANGGIFLIDDFGRQRVDPHDMLNRWIIPLENQIDHLTLHTGRTFQIPYRQMLILATNLDPDVVMDQAFLRRMGYRLHLDRPTAEDYSRIFRHYASKLGLTVGSDLIDRLLNRYRAENKDLRCCEPRDLIERARDICRFRDSSLVLDEQTLDLAWTGYFGNKTAAG